MDEELPYEIHAGDGPRPDPAAARRELEELARNHRLQLHRFVTRKLRDPVESEEIVQQALMEAARTIDRFRGESQLKTWVYGIANNLISSHLRRSPYRRHHFESEKVLADEPAECADPADIVEHRELLARIAEVADELPPDLLETMMQVLDGESSYQEAADQLQIPIGTVRSRVSRARSTLRKKVFGAGRAV